jgi:hypothetical protein
MSDSAMNFATFSSRFAFLFACSLSILERSLSSMSVAKGFWLRVPPANPADDDRAECAKVLDRLASGIEEEAKGTRTEGILTDHLL